MGLMPEIEKPNLNEAELYHFLHYEEGLVDVTRRAVKWAIIRREIVPTRIGNRNMFSRKDGLDWIRSCRGRQEPREPSNAK
ncbi:hypothetical protein [Mycolicibacterium tusciae]|uniref:hypothetical protein n=1 Tax=Mycolicibacterium tusciae TaxID=75922 RepID=UPI00024A26F3|nr:hypothetical protein [Mycolicibacterium tusciae]